MISHTVPARYCSKTSIAFGLFTWIVSAFITPAFSSSAERAGVQQHEHAVKPAQNQQYVQCYNGICVVESKHNIEVLEHARQAAQKGQYVECYNGICLVADEKHPQAHNVLGHMYEEGIGVEKNLQKAMQSYEKAATGGVPDAECRLGHMYYHGTAGKKDPEKAVFWLTRAAKHNVAEAQNTLGHMYLAGDGVKKDVQAASNWLHRAAINAPTEAVKAIEHLPPVKPFTKETPAGLAFEQTMGNIETGWQGYGDIVQSLRKAEEPAMQPQ